MSADHPTREMDNPQVPESLRHALRSAREAGPGAERLARARESMVQRAAVEVAGGAAAIGASLIGSTGPSAAAGAASSSAAAVGTGAMATSVGKVLLIGALLGLGGGGLWWWDQQGDEGTTAAPATAPAGPPPVSVETEVVPAAQAAEPAAQEVDPEPVVETEPAPEEVAPAPEEHRGRRVQRRSKPAPRPPARELSLGDEIALLTEARASLQDRPAETLRLASEHAEFYPRGRFVQEREVLAVHALLRRGKRDAALERGRHFLQTYPNSTHARRVDALLQAAEP